MVILVAILAFYLTLSLVESLNICYAEEGKTDEIIMIAGSCDTRKTPEWIVTSGIKVNNWFYLVGPKLVYSFPLSAFENPGTVVKLTEIPRDQFAV